MESAQLFAQFWLFFFFSPNIQQRRKAKSPFAPPSFRLYFRRSLSSRQLTRESSSLLFLTCRQEILGHREEQRTAGSAAQRTSTNMQWADDDTQALVASTQAGISLLVLIFVCLVFFLEDKIASGKRNDNFGLSVKTASRWVSINKMYANFRAEGGWAF